METDGEQSQQGASTNGSAASGTTTTTSSSSPSSRPSPMNSMSLYERQAVQALQALQRQPNAAQYFQQLMLQQQINNAQLQNLAAVQQVTVLDESTSSCSSYNFCFFQASVTSGTGSTTSSRPMGASATSTISQSVLLSGTAAGQGQMYLRVNRSLRAPISSQLIFMPGSTATAAVATVAQQPQHQQQAEATPTSSAGGQLDNDQAQNLAMRGVTGPKGVKTEAPERSDSGRDDILPQTSTLPPSPSPPHIKIPTYPQPTNLKAHPSSSSGATSSSSSIPLSQLLLHGTRTLATGTSAPTAAHTLVLTSNAGSQPHGYPVGTATIKPAVNAQTLVKSGHGNGPVPIQPKTLQGLRLPLHLPSRNPPPILPAPPPASSSAQSSQLPPPHIPVQIVGARQSTLGNTQAMALARGSCSQDGAAAVLTSSSSLLTMVASIASREGGVVGRGVGLKALQSPQEAPPLAQVSQVHPQANQSSAQSQNGSLAQNPASSQSPGVSSPPSSLSRSSLSLPLTTGEKNCPPPPLSGSGAPPPAPPSPSPVLSVSRGACGPGERAPPPQAVVKPHVLTHLIEGFVIQEGAEPFPVISNPTLNICSALFVLSPPVLKCEYCKNFAPAGQFRGTKRFCSMACAKRYFQQLSVNPVGPPPQCRSESSRSDEESSGEEDEDDPMSLSPASSSASCRQPASPLLPLTEGSGPGCPPAAAALLPAQWSVEDVSQFISSLQGCEELASQFLSQEIDGQALLLLKEEHLMSTMNIKLGPALKICAHINNLRD
uniref:Polyhomeotic-like protein 1 n=1 Tax=Scophthalmus maximus TaxID=52904 RepID=A0A8D3ALF6_SCOMX